MGESAQRVTYEFDRFQVDPAQRLLRSRANGAALPLTAKAFETLLYLVEHRGQLIDKATLMHAIWPNVVVEENNLTQNISALRRVLGESATEHRFIVTVPGRGYRFVAEVNVLEGGRRTERGNPAPPAERWRGGQAGPQIQFCTTSDGVRLAYTSSGTGPAVVRTAHWLSHVEYDWGSPVYRHLLQAVSQRHRLIRYDQRGNGLSDRDVPEISLETMVRDLETVTDAMELERFALMGLSMGTPVAIAYAVHHPERVSHLVLYGAFAKALRTDDEVEALATLMRQHWGQSNPAFRQF